MKITAFDVKQDGVFCKEWATLDPTIQVCSCRANKEALTQSLSESADGLVLIHTQCATATEVALGMDGLLCMFVSGGGLSENHSNPKKHYSKRKVPSSTSLAHLAPKFVMLCKSLEAAGDDTTKISSAWANWEYSNLEHVVEILSPTAILPGDQMVMDQVKNRLDELIERIGSAGQQSIKDDLERFSDIPGVFALNGQIQHGVFTGSNFLSNWLENYPGCLPDMSRRLL